MLHVVFGNSFPLSLIPQLYWRGLNPVGDGLPNWKTDVVHPSA